MNKRYTLQGFASGKGHGPHFIEPVFSDGTELFIQTSEDINGAETVSNFKRFDDQVDYFEYTTDESSAIGEQCTFGVIDSGDRLVYGDKKYVSRYLSQNIRNYIDHPYFLQECLEFTGESLPEFAFIETSKDLLELSVAVKSIKEFTRSSPTARQWLLQTFDKKAAIHHSDELSNWASEDRTIIGAWLSFANSKNHKIAKSSRWSDLEDSLLSIYDYDSVRANKNMINSYIALHKILEGDIQEIPENSYNKAKDLIRNYTSNRGDNNTSYYNVAKFVSIRSLKAIEMEIKENEITKTLKMIRRKKLSNTKMSVILFFLSLSIKITIDLISDRKRE